MVDVSTRHVNDDEQVTVKQVELDNGDVYEFEGPPGGPYEYPLEDQGPPREAVRALQEHVGDDVELDVDEVATPAGAGEQVDRSGGE